MGDKLIQWLQKQPFIASLFYTVTFSLLYTAIVIITTPEQADMDGHIYIMTAVFAFPFFAFAAFAVSHILLKYKLLANYHTLKIQKTIISIGAVSLIALGFIGAGNLAKEHICPEYGCNTLFANIKVLLKPEAKLIELLQNSETLKQDVNTLLVIDRLGTIKSTKSVPVLIKILENYQTKLQGQTNSSAAARALGIIQDKRAIIPLIGALNSKQSNLRQLNANRALKKFGSSAVPSLIASLKDGDKLVKVKQSKEGRKLQIFLLASTKDASVLPLLSEMLLEGDETESFAAGRALTYFEAKSIPIFKKGIQSGNYIAKKNAIKELARMPWPTGEDFIHAFEEELNNKKASVRIEATNALLSKRSVNSIPRLENALQKEKDYKAKHRLRSVLIHLRKKPKEIELCKGRRIWIEYIVCKMR